MPVDEATMEAIRKKDRDEFVSKEQVDILHRAFELLNSARVPTKNRKWYNPETDCVEVFQGDKLDKSYMCRYGGLGYQVEDERQYVVSFYVISGLLKCPWVE